MKKLITFLTLLTLFFTTVWAKTMTLDYSTLQLTTTLTSNTPVTVYDDGDASDGVNFLSSNLKRNGTAKDIYVKYNGVIYNTTPFPGSIAYVVINCSNNQPRVTTIWGSSDGEEWKEVITASAPTGSSSNDVRTITGDFQGKGYKYFKITRGTSTSYWNNVLIIYTTGSDNSGDVEEYVDLGLTSRTRWATKNIGASRPEEYGQYFAWGETMPKEVYNYNSYQWSGDKWNTINKYCTSSNYGDNGFVDGKTELDLEDDAAKANWGPKWLMPTKEQIDELRTECTWTWTTKNGIEGYQVSKNGKSIFLPAAGFRDGNAFYNNPNRDSYYSYYWSRTLDEDEPNQAYDVWSFWKEGTNNNPTLGSNARYDGYTVRAVRAPIPEVSTVEQILALEDGTEFKFTGNLVVSGKSLSGKDLYAQDATGGVHFFDEKENPTIPNYTFGQIIPPGFLATKTTHNGAVELIDMQDMSPATNSGELIAEELTPSQVTQDNPFIYALINNALIEQPGTFPRINVNGEIVSLQEGTFNEETLTVGGIYNIYGVTNWNNGARFMPLEAELLENVHTITCKAISDVPLNHDEQTFKPGGTIEAKVDGDKVTLATTGDEVTLDITPWNGYTLTSVTVNDEEIRPVDGVYSFVMPNEDVEVIANFVAGGYPITVVSSNSDGIHHSTFTCPSFATVGDNVKLTITDVEYGYSIMGVSATFTNSNGGTTSVSVKNEGNGEYSFGMPPFPVTVTINYHHHLLVAGDWDLVTEVSQLVEGNSYIIVHQGENPSAMSTTQNRNNRGTTGITLNADYSVATITNEDTQVFTLEGDASGWYFNAGSGYLYAASSNNNWLRTGNQKNDDAKAAISISGGIASIVFQGTNQRNDLRYNENGNTPLFSCYAGTSDLPKVSLYTRGKFNPGDLVHPNPPEFWPDPNEDPELLLPEDFYVELWTEYEDMGAIYYMLDPSTPPTNSLDVINNGKRCDYGYGYGEIFVTGPGSHTIYAVVEVEYEGQKYQSVYVSRTYNTYSMGDWHLVTNDNELFVPHYEYIVVSDDFEKAIGSYNDTYRRFNAVVCNEDQNVVFDPSFETATVNSDDVKVFTLEYYEGEGIWKNGYLKDAQGNYYYAVGHVSEYDENPPAQAIEDSKGIVWAYTGGHTGYVYLDSDNSNVAYNSTNGYFDCHNWNYPTSEDEHTRIRLYYRPKPVPLAVMEAGQRGYYYTISDNLLAVKCVTDAYNNAYLFCKDEGPSIKETENTENYEDYMTVNTNFNGDWDQSNWIGLMFYGVNDDAVQTLKELEGKRLEANSITVYHNNRDNFIYEMKMSDLKEESDQITSYSPNLYCPANFLQSNHNGAATGSGIYADRHYFFMNPKLQEVCDVTFAVWDGNYFVLPAPDGKNNITGIAGAFYPDFLFNDKEFEDPETGEFLSIYDVLKPGQAYKFKAIVQGRQPKKATVLKEDDTEVTPGNYKPDWYYTVYPFEFDPNDQESIITAVENVSVVGNGKVVSVKYVNIAGMVSDRPFQGVNIVVTRYSDGSTTTTKIIK